MLNRTTSIARVPSGPGRPGPETGKECAEFEKCTAEATETLAAGLEKITGKSFSMLHDANRQMLAAAEVLPGCKFEAAVPHDKQALSNLIKARNTVREVLAKGGNQQLRNFDRSQVQKLRRPKELDEDKRAEQVAERLRQLAKQEEFVYATVAKPSDQAAKPAQQQSPSARGKSEQEKTEKTESGKDGGKENEGKEDARKKDGQDLKKRQADVVEEARAIQQALERLGKAPGSPGLSELAESRMTKAVEKAEKVAAALDRGSRSDAAKSSRDAAGRFRELADHVEGLLDRDLAGRLASARDMAGQLARRERELAEREGRENGQNGSSLAESARTLEDVLRALGRGGDQGTIRPETLRQIEKLLRESDVSALAKRIQEVEAKLATGRGPDVRTEAREIAERLDMLAQQLEVLHRQVVAPRLEALIALEKRAAALAERLKRLDSQAAIAQWHREADGLLQDLARLAPDAAVTARLTEAMRAHGWGTDRVAWDRRYVAGYWLPPDAYTTSLNAIIDELQQHVGEMLLRETVSGTDEATPPQYKELVERYFQVLSQRGSRNK